MNFDVLKFVRDLRGLDGLAKAVLYSLATRADEHGVCWPSLSRISEESGIARSSVCKKLNELVQKGVLSREVGATNENTKYTFLPTAAWTTIEQASPPDGLPITSFSSPPHGPPSPPSGLPSPPHGLDLVRHTDSPSPPHGPEVSTKVTKKNVPRGKSVSQGSGDFEQAQAVGLDLTAPQELRGVWVEWQTYRAARHRGEGGKKVAWTAQAARIAAQRLASAAAAHAPTEIVEAVITAILSGWAGFFLDKLKPSNSASSASGRPSSAGSLPLTQAGTKDWLPFPGWELTWRTSFPDRPRPEIWKNLTRQEMKLIHATATKKSA